MNDNKIEIYIHVDIYRMNNIFCGERRHFCQLTMIILCSIEGSMKIYYYCYNEAVNPEENFNQHF